MEVTLTEQLDVKVIDVPFEMWMEFSRKSGVTKDYWFTPSGKCKIWVGGLHLQHLGKLGEGQYDQLMAEMKNAKCDVLSTGNNYYTTGNNNLIKINNMGTILDQATKEWKERFEV
jgi:hypothetical protein